MERRSNSLGITRSRTGIAAFGTAILVFVALVVAMAACGGSSTPTSAAAPAATGGATGAPSGSAQVAMQGSAFSPQTVTIPVGGTVTWTNKDSMNHTVTADGGAFQSGDLGNGATFSFTFDTAGTYAYHCTIHPSMTGTVVVQ